MRKVFQSLVTLIVGVCALHSAAFPQSAPFTILTNADLPSGCAPQYDDDGAKYYAGCCGSPGRRQCVVETVASLGLLNGCMAPSSTVAVDPYTLYPLCTMASPGPDPGLGAVFQNLGPGTPNRDMTFYVTSDIHFFRDTFNLTDQLAHVKALNDLGNPNWPTGTGIPAHTPVATPSVVIVDGDLTTHGQPYDLGAFRLNYEEGTTADSLKYPMMFGLGNHELASNETAQDAHRMFDYLTAKMSPFVNMDFNPQTGSGSGNYSWDWQGVHMVQLNTWAGDKTSLYAHPSDGLTWLKNDLQAHVGKSTNPVMIFQHYGFNSITKNAADSSDDWATNLAATDLNGGSTDQGFESFWSVIDGYNVIGLFSGHDHCLGSYSSSSQSTVLFDTYYLTSTATYPSVPGYGQNVDDYDDGSGGDTSTGQDAPNSAGARSVCKYQNGISKGTIGSFLTTRVTNNYLDVAAVSWSENGEEYFDPAINFTNNSPACRKRINSQFIPVPDTDGQVAPNENGYSVTTSIPMGVPVALQFSSSNALANFDFNDVCAGGNAYVLVNGENALANTGTVSVPVALKQGSNQPATPKLVALTPLSGASPASFSFVTAFAPNSTTAVAAPSDQTVAIYGPPNAAFTLTTEYLTSTQGWLTVQSVPSSTTTFGPLGTATLNLHFVATALQATQEGNVQANVQVTTAATGVTYSVPVEVTFKAPVTVTLTANPANSFQPGSGNAEFTAALGYTPQSQNGDTLAISGAVTLRQQTLNSMGQVTGSTVLSTSYVNNSADCGKESPADNTVVFGGTGNSGDYCPSQAGTNGGPYTFNLPIGLYSLAAYYEGQPGNSGGNGDSAYAPAVSPTMTYRVGDPVTGLSKTSGDNQSASLNGYFEQPLTVQLSTTQGTIAGGGVMNASVTFTVQPGPLGASGSFNGQTSITYIADKTGTVTTPPILSNGRTGIWTVMVSVSGFPVKPVVFTLTNNLAATAPVIELAIGTTKLGSLTNRLWGILLTNAGTAAAANVTVNSMTFTQEGGPVCSPSVSSGLPFTIPLLASTPGSNSKNDQLYIDFPSPCTGSSRFTVQINVTANGGAYTNNFVIGHMFP